MAKISVCIITFNEEKFVGQCIEAVKGFADEIIVVDSHSFDKTVQIAKKLGAKVFRKKFSDFAAQRNFALTKAKNEWIFFPDPDEICPKELAQEIVETVNSKNSADGYWIPYKNHYGKKELKYGGESYYHMRLFRRKNAKYDQIVHEEAKIAGTEGKMKNKIIHFSYPDLSDLLQKLNHYSSLEAKARKMKGEKFSLLKLIFHPVGSFFYRLIWWKGILDGLEGLILATTFAFYRFQVNVKLWELEKEEVKARTITSQTTISIFCYFN